MCGHCFCFFLFGHIFLFALRKFFTDSAANCRQDYSRIVLPLTDLQMAPVHSTASGSVFPFVTASSLERDTAGQEKEKAGITQH